MAAADVSRELARQIVSGDAPMVLDIHAGAMDLERQVLGPLSAAGIQVGRHGALIAEELYQIPMMELGQILEVTVNGEKCPPIGMVLGNVVGKPEVKQVYKSTELAEAEAQGMSVVSAGEVLSTMEVPCKHSAGCAIDNGASDGVFVASIEPSSTALPSQGSSELSMPGLLNTLPESPAASSSEASASGVASGSRAPSGSGAGSADGRGASGGRGGEANAADAVWTTVGGGSDGAWTEAGPAPSEAERGRAAPPPASDEAGELVAEWGDEPGGVNPDGDGDGDGAPDGGYAGEEAHDAELELSEASADADLPMGPSPAAAAWSGQGL
eukprot:tig00021127_g18731.t1